MQDFDIPAGIERDLVVGDPERSLLGLREARQDDDRDLSKPHRPGGLKPAMARDDMAGWINKDWIGEAKRFDGCADLIDLALGMGAGVARIGNEVAYRAVGDGQPRGGQGGSRLIHEWGLAC